MLLDNLGPGAAPISLHSGEGALVFGQDGKSYWDFYGGHAVTLIGLGHPRWVEAIAHQARQLSFMTTVVDVPVRRRAAAALCEFTGMDRVFFVNSGAEANEAALKIARKATGRPVIVAMTEGFHGRTMGALGVTDHYRDQHAPAHGAVRFVPFGDLAALKAALSDDVAAVIAEPVQGMAGVVMPPTGWLAGVQAAAHAAGALLICDEIQCGVGRMGVPVVARAQGAEPDLLTLGKGVGGGFPVAACLMPQAVADTVKPGEHGTTFGGAPMACAAVDATLAILRDEELLPRALALGEHLQGALRGVAGVLEVRGAGAWAGVVLDRPARSVMQALRDAGFLVGTSTDPRVLRLAPAALMPHFAVDMLARALAAALGEPGDVAA